MPFQAHPTQRTGSPPHQRDLAVDLRGVLALRVGVLHGGQLKQAHAKAAGRSRRGGTTSVSGMSAQARRWVIRAQHSRLRQCQAETAAEMGCDCTPNRSPAQIGGGAPYHAQACRQPPNSLHSPRTHSACSPAAQTQPHMLPDRLQTHLYTSTLSSYSSSYSSGAMNSGVPSTLCGAVRERSMVASPRSPIFTTPSAGGSSGGGGKQG